MEPVRNGCARQRSGRCRNSKILVYGREGRGSAQADVEGGGAMHTIVGWLRNLGQAKPRDSISMAKLARRHLEGQAACHGRGLQPSGVGEADRRLHLCGGGGLTRSRLRGLGNQKRKRTGAGRGVEAGSLAGRCGGGWAHFGRCDSRAQLRRRGSRNWRGQIGKEVIGLALCEQLVPRAGLRGRSDTGRCRLRRCRGQKHSRS